MKMVRKKEKGQDDEMTSSMELGGASARKTIVLTEPF